MFSSHCCNVTLRFVLKVKALTWWNVRSAQLQHSNLQREVWTKGCDTGERLTFLFQSHPEHKECLRGTYIWFRAPPLSKLRAANQSRRHLHRATSNNDNHYSEGAQRVWGYAICEMFGNLWVDSRINHLGTKKPLQIRQRRIIPPPLPIWCMFTDANQSEIDSVLPLLCS